MRTLEDVIMQIAKEEDEPTKPYIFVGPPEPEVIYTAFVSYTDRNGRQQRWLTQLDKPIKRLKQAR